MNASYIILCALAILVVEASTTPSEKKNETTTSKQPKQDYDIFGMALRGYYKDDDDDDDEDDDHHHDNSKNNNNNDTKYGGWENRWISGSGSTTDNQKSKAGAGDKSRQMTPVEETLTKSLYAKFVAYEKMAESYELLGLGVKLKHILVHDALN
ncbi:transmembrane protein DDB_G0274347-like [Octopus sinensis]|uniref:Transmembrane protein DDB_G0274347-like n=1 Tax=Octopus sinensis TaxID=2607531 RepID=A0A6P7T5J8_9MOLL|nr:transmembrane protein DDB_G0274347-like [Octopus sinensis]